MLEEVDDEISLCAAAEDEAVDDEDVTVKILSVFMELEDDDDDDCCDERQAKRAKVGIVRKECRHEVW